MVLLSGDQNGAQGSFGAFKWARLLLIKIANPQSAVPPVSSDYDTAAIGGKRPEADN
jgi:hypothetical protein